MIHCCPFCGHDLQRVLKDGLAHCSHCSQIFGSSEFNRLLAASWFVRRRDLNLDQLIFHLNLTDKDAEFILEKIVDEGLSHQDFQNLLNKLNIDKSI